MSWSDTWPPLVPVKCRLLDQSRWMRGYVAGDPIVQRLGTPEELGQESSKCEDSRSHERRSKSQPLTGRGHVVPDPIVWRLGTLGDSRCGELISSEALELRSNESHGSMDLRGQISTVRSEGR
jgi:hypothetical protein